MSDPLHLFRFAVLNLSGIALLAGVAVKFLRYHQNEKRRNEKIKRQHPAATLTMLFVLAALCPFLVWKIGYVETPQPEQYFYAGLGTALVILSVVLHLQAKIDIGKNWSDAIEVDERHNVVKTGAYAIVRHPMYSSLIFWAVGLSVLFVNPLVAALTFAVFVPMMYWRAKAEEQLIAEYADDPAGYSIYRERVNILMPRFGGGFAVVLRVAAILVYGFFIIYYTGSNFSPAAVVLLTVMHLLLGFTLLPEKAAFSYKSKTGMLVLFWVLAMFWQPLYYVQWFFWSMYVYGLFFNCPCMFVYEKYHGCPCFALLKRTCKIR